MAAVLAEPRNHIWDEITELGLEKYVADMDHDGFCTLPPEIANPNNLAERMLEALVDLAEKRNGERPDLETGATHAYQPKFLYGAKNERYGRSQLKDQTPALKSPADLGKEDSPFGDRMHSIFYEDPVFAEALMNPAMLAMVTYLLGYSAVLSNMGCWMKGPCKSNFPLHTDCGGMPSPLPQQAYAAQCTYLLTDFSRGERCDVPRTGESQVEPQPHWQGKTLLPYEEGGSEQAVACEAPAGSIVIWHGNAWHGAFNRTAPGIRVSVTVYFNGRSCARWRTSSTRSPRRCSRRCSTSTGHGSRWCCSTAAFRVTRPRATACRTPRERISTSMLMNRPPG